MRSAYIYPTQIVVNMHELSLKDLFDGNFYHISTEGLEQVTLLKDEEDYRIAWNYLALVAWRTGVDIVAFVLMSNHIHTLLACRNVEQAKKAIKLFKQLLSTYLRNKYGMSHAMHNSSDSISLIDTIKYLRNCIAYIFRNPISARICLKPEDYKWSSYHSCFKQSAGCGNARRVADLKFVEKRQVMRTGQDLTECPLFVDDEGYVTLDSFVRNDIVSNAFWNSGKSFMYHLGSCNDAKTEYELVYQPMMEATDNDMYDAVSKSVAERFRNKTISDLTTPEKCSIIKTLFFSHKTTVPQLARIIGLPRELVRKMLLQ